MITVASNVKITILNITMYTPLININKHRMLHIKIKQFLFTPSLLPSIITAALLYLMISLAFWQLDRAEYKSNLQTIIESKQNTDALDFNIVDKTDDKWLYQPVFIEGQFDPAFQLLYDNQVNNMIAGYSIFTPLKISSTQAILVNRGWLPTGKSRSILPDISITEQLRKVRLNGLLAPPPSKTLVLSSNANSYAQWPAILQYIDIAEIEQHLNIKLLPMTLIMNESGQTNFDILPIRINMRSEKHTAYAFQWFALSFTLFIIYIIVNTKRTEHS
ncbi:Cytochrome oxidase biogenesis protein Surf1, facilitates heme A insertion [hydrothermal vent metagenome]|uniref:Cytochrome oxidase biogenesis protein Surf1, facilitates heme A insertion n=1 Tax=hydrothermal vent metagenome TaxID=652676 RepID=A0A3B0XB45_9ZZZZ